MLEVLDVMHAPGMCRVWFFSHALPFGVRKNRSEVPPWRESSPVRVKRKTLSVKLLKRFSASQEAPK
jgi:hypothetical protein